MSPNTPRTTRAGWLLLLLLPALAACRGPALPPAPSGPPDEVRDVSLMNGFFTIRLEIPTGPPGPKPAIISPIGDHDVLLQAGAIVVTYQTHWELLRGLAAKPATPPPPNTVGVWLLASPSAATIGKGYFTLIDGTATDQIPKVVDYLLTVPEVDPTRIGIAGASTNGFKALQAIAADPRIAAAVVFTACGDYHCFLQHSSLAMKGEPLALEPDYEAWLRQREPIHHPQRLTHAAILMVNGTDDKAVPYRCMERTLPVFHHAYRRAGVPERFRAVAIDGGTHNLDERAAHEAMAWWFRWLLPPGTPPGHER